MNPFRTSLVSFLGGLSVYFGALLGFLVLDRHLHGAWLVPGSLFFVGGFLLGLGLCRSRCTTAKKTVHTPLAVRVLPETHDQSYALSLAMRTSHMPRPR
jgi:hypothetical protein